MLLKAAFWPAVAPRLCDGSLEPSWWGQRWLEALCAHWNYPPPPPTLVGGWWCGGLVVWGAGGVGGWWWGRGAGGCFAHHLVL